MTSLEGQSCPLLKRSSQRTPTAPERRRRLDRSERAARGDSRNLPMWLVLGMGAVAVTVPLTAFVAPSNAGAQEKVVATFTGANAWRTTGVSAAKLPTASDLAEDQAATSRSTMNSPLEVSSCIATVAPANGLRELNQKEPFHWPLEEGSYTQASTFSWRISPITGELMLHEGVDWAASQGTPIYAAAPGVVSEVGYNDRSGNFVIISHDLEGTVFTTHYYHQPEGGPKVTVGQEVKAGEQVGVVGNTGWSTGPHLHFEIRNADGNAIEPLAFMGSLGAKFLGEACQ